MKKDFFEEMLVKDFLKRAKKVKPLKIKKKTPNYKKMYEKALYLMDNPDGTGEFF